MKTLEIVLRGLLSLAFIGAGVYHFVRADLYKAVVPPYLPYPLALVYISGAAEIAGGVGAQVKPLRKPAGWGLIALLLAVLPANIHMATDPAFAQNLQTPRWVLWARVPFQGVLIAWVWWTTLSQPRRPR